MERANDGGELMQQGLSKSKHLEVWRNEKPYYFQMPHFILAKEMMSSLVAPEIVICVCRHLRALKKKIPPEDT